jgi:hypothetical protein
MYMNCRQCWVEHMRLNRTTGGDPDGIKLRPAQGLEAVDYIMPGWVYNILSPLYHGPCPNKDDTSPYGGRYISQWQSAVNRLETAWNIRPVVYF